MKFKNLDGWTSGKANEPDLLNGLSRRERTFVLEKIIGRNDKDAALAAVLLAQHGREHEAENLEAASPGGISETDGSVCAASPQDTARQTRSRREKCYGVGVSSCDSMLTGSALLNPSDRNHNSPIIRC